MSILNPDDFPEDWYGYLTNQSGHFVLGLFLAYALPWWVILIGYSAWELYHLYLGATLIDSLEDTAFVMLGAAFFNGFRKYAMIATMMTLSIGVFRRGRK